MTKVIATAILSPEQVTTLLQAEEGGDKVGGDVRGERDVEEEIRGEAKKVGPIYQNKTTAKLITQLNKLPHMVHTYNLLCDMETE